MAQQLPKIEGWQIGNLSVSGRGAKTAPVLNSKGQALPAFRLSNLTNPLRSPWGACQFDKDAKLQTRLNIDFACPPELERLIHELDSWCVREAAKNSTRLFKRELPEAEVKGLYKSCLTQRGSYPPTLRCKINVAGHKQVKCWDEHLQLRPAPNDWKLVECIPNVQITHIWFMGSSFGPVFEVKDALVLEREVVCPFG